MVDINVNMSVELTGGDLKALITEWAEKKVPGHVVKYIDFSIANTSDDRFGYSADYSLTKATIHMKPKVT